MGTWIGAVEEVGKALLGFVYTPCCIVCEASIENAELLCEESMDGDSAGSVFINAGSCLGRRGFGL